MKLNTKNKKPLKQIVLGVLVSWLWDSNPRPADYKAGIYKYIIELIPCNYLYNKDLWREAYN